MIIRLFPQRVLLSVLFVSVSLITALLLPGISQASVDQVRVDKSERKMYLIRQGKVVKNYDIALGANPWGHKQQEGDERTPEGVYTLDYKKEDSAFYRSMHISYPNSHDKAQAARKGVSPGGFIMVHGQRNGLGHRLKYSLFTGLLFASRLFTNRPANRSTTSTPITEIT